MCAILWIGMHVCVKHVRSYFSVLKEVHLRLDLGMIVRPRTNYVHLWLVKCIPIRRRKGTNETWFGRNRYPMERFDAIKRDKYPREWLHMIKWEIQIEMKWIRKKFERVLTNSHSKASWVWSSNNLPTIWIEKPLVSV